MKQKLALACTLVHEPRLILLDEPTTGVDPVSRREFWKLLSEFLANGITILMSTPYLDEAERCTRVALIHEGRVLAADEPARLRELIPGRMLEVIAHGTAAADTLRALPGVRRCAGLRRARPHHAGRGVGTRARGVQGRPGSQRRWPSAPVRRVQPSLEDVFIAQLSGGPHSPRRGLGEAGRENAGA